MASRASLISPVHSAFLSPEANLRDDVIPSAPSAPSAPTTSPPYLSFPDGRSVRYMEASTVGKEGIFCLTGGGGMPSVVPSYSKVVHGYMYMHDAPYKYNRPAASASWAWAWAIRRG